MAAWLLSAVGVLLVSIVVHQVIVRRRCPTCGRRALRGTESVNGMDEVFGERWCEIVNEYRCARCGARVRERAGEWETIVDEPRASLDKANLYPDPDGVRTLVQSVLEPRGYEWTATPRAEIGDVGLPTLAWA